MRRVVLDGSSISAGGERGLASTTTTIEEFDTSLNSIWEFSTNDDIRDIYYDGSELWAVGDNSTDWDGHPGGAETANIFKFGSTGDLVCSLDIDFGEGITLSGIDGDGTNIYISASNRHEVNI
jgi:hypothetical protein